MSSAPFYWVILKRNVHVPSWLRVLKKKIDWNSPSSGDIETFSEMRAKSCGGNLAGREEQHKHKAFKISPCGQNKGQDGMKREQLNNLHTTGFIQFMHLNYF